MSSRKQTRNQVPLSVARELILHQMELLQGDSLDARDIAPLMLWGAPGIGKSALIRELCTEHQWGFVDVRLAQRDPVDMRGLPVPDGNMVRWLQSSEWPRDPDSRGIILFDELTAADRTLQVSAYEFILDRRLGDTYQVPRGWLVCGAGNRSEDSAVSVPMSSALANRFLHLDLGADMAEWARWAIGHGIHNEVIAFLRFRPQLLLDMDRGDLQRGWPSPRSWARVAAVLQTAQKRSQAARDAAIEGLVGQGAAIELAAFLSVVSKLPNLESVLRGDERLEIPKSLDLRLAVVTGLACYVWLVPDLQRACGIFLGIGQRLTPDFATMMLVDALDQAKPPQIKALVNHPEFAEWLKTHGEIFAQRYPDVAPLVLEQRDYKHQPKQVDDAMAVAVLSGLAR